MDRVLSWSSTLPLNLHTIGPLVDAAAKKGWEITGLWLTHGHFDHFADHAVLRQRVPGARILIHQLDEPKARHPEVQTRLFGLPFAIDPLKADAHVTGDQNLAIGKIKVTVLHTPGHSPGHVVYYLPDEHVLVGGDLIIGGSIGRTDLPDSDHEQMEESVRRVMKRRLCSVARRKYRVSLSLNRWCR